MSTTTTPKGTIKLAPGTYEIAQLEVKGSILIEGLEGAEATAGRALENNVGDAEVGRVLDEDGIAGTAEDVRPRRVLPLHNRSFLQR